MSATPVNAYLAGEGVPCAMEERSVQQRDAHRVDEDHAPRKGRKACVPVAVAVDRVVLVKVVLAAPSVARRHRELVALEEVEELCAGSNKHLPEWF